MAEKYEKGFFPLKTGLIEPDKKLPFDIYLYADSKFVLFRGEYDSIDNKKLKILVDRKSRLYIPLAQKKNLEVYLKTKICDHTLPSPKKAVFLKETAFYHLNDIFARGSKGEIGEMVDDSFFIVKNMMDYMTDDVSSIKNLLKLSTHDYYTYNHSVDVSVYCMALARKLYPKDKDTVFEIGVAGLLHDIGKSRVDPAIINKPGKLDEDEWNEMRKHPEHGVALLKKNKNISKEIIRIVYEHHENYDGSGYPRGIKGYRIHPLSKLTAIADVFDALTTKRSYSKPLSAKDALKLMSDLHKNKFDPQIFNHFKSILHSDKIVIK